MPRLKKRDDFSQGFKWGPPDTRAITAADTVQTGEDGEDEVILVDATSGTVTVTLPSAAGDVKDFYIIKKTDVSGNAVETVTISWHLIRTIPAVARTSGSP